MRRLNTHFLILIIILGVVGLLNSYWVFLNYSSMSEAYTEISNDYDEMLIKYSRDIAESIATDTVDLGEPYIGQSDFNLLIEPYYVNGNEIYLRKSNNYYRYEGMYVNRLKELYHFKQELSTGKVDQTVHWLQKVFAGSTVLVLLISFFIYRYFTRKFRKNLNALMDTIQTPENQGQYDFLEFDEIQKAIQKYHIISTQVQKQMMVVDLMTNWKLEIRKLIHDLKNPIQRLMLSVSNQPDSNVAISSIEEINQKLKELRSNDGADEINPEPIELDSFFKRLKSLFYDIEINYENTLSTEFVFDSFGFQRICSNLIQNAVEASASKIDFKFYSEDGLIICDISNNGKTIENKDKLFVPFATTKKHGTGLGLVIMLQIVHAHGGQFYLKKSNEEMTTFTLLLFTKDTIK